MRLPGFTPGTPVIPISDRPHSSDCGRGGSGDYPLKILDREGPSIAPEGRAFLMWMRSSRLVSGGAISAIRTKAELARRLSSETRDPAAKAGLLELASLLDADADRLESSAQEPAAETHKGQAPE